MKFDPYVHLSVVSHQKKAPSIDQQETPFWGTNPKWQNLGPGPKR